MRKLVYFSDAHAYEGVTRDSRENPMRKGSTMTLTVEIPESLTAQQNALTAKLAELDLQQTSVAEQKKEVQSNLIRISVSAT